MDNEDREATPAEPSSSHLCETIDDIDGYLSGEAPSSDVIDSSHLFSTAFHEDDHLEESNSKSPTSSPCLLPFSKTYNYNEDAIPCQVDQSHFCDHPDIYAGPSSDSKPSESGFNSIELDDTQPGPSSSGNLSIPRQDFQSDSSNSSFEPTSNENREEGNFKLNYSVMNFGQVSEASSRVYNASTSKQPDSSEFTRCKGPGKIKSLKGKGKGKMTLKQNILPQNSNINKLNPHENGVESTNKLSLFALRSSRLNPILDIEGRVNQSGLGNTSETEASPANASSSSSRCDFIGQRNVQNLSEDEAYMVAKNSNINKLNPHENDVESTNKLSLFALRSSRLNPILDIEGQVNQSGLSNTSETEASPANASSSSSRCDFIGQRNVQNLSEDEAYMVASSSGNLSCMEHIIDLKSPTTPSDSCLVSSSTGQLDSLPPTPVNFQGNDASHSSPASSPLNPPVLDSTVDSTSGQNILSSPYSSDDNEIARSNDEIEFGCSLDEERNQISTSVSHLHHGVDSQDLNLLVGTQSVFAGQQPNANTHFVGPFINLESFNSHSLHSTLPDQKNTAEAVSALIPTSSAYLPDCLEMPGSSHMSDSSKRLLYGRRKEAAYQSSLNATNSTLSQSSAPLNTINNLSFGDENALASCNPAGDLSHVRLVELHISEMEPESSNLVASSANIDNEEFQSASSGSAMSPSNNNFESGSTLAQLNQHYLLGIGENSLSSEDCLSPQSVSQAGPSLSEGSLGLGQHLREAEESLESSSNFTDSLELGLGPQQLRRIMESRQEPQSLIPPPHLLEEAHNADLSASNGHMDSAEPILASVKTSESIPVAVVSAFSTASQVSSLMHSEAVAVSNENSFVITSETSGSHSPDFSVIDGSKSDGKNNPYRLPNGVLKNEEASKVLMVGAVPGNPDPGQAQQQSLIFSGCYEDRGSILAAVSQNPVPVNIHSLFGHRSSTSKTLVTTKPTSGFSYFTSKAGETNQGISLESDSLGQKDSLDENSTGGSSTLGLFSAPGTSCDLSSANECQNTIDNLIKEEFVQSQHDHLSPNIHHSTSQETNEVQENDSMLVESSLPCTQLNKDSHAASSGMLLEEEVPSHHGERILPSIEDSGHVVENEYWCGDCERFLTSKCRTHRIQTIMDKPVLSRAWASLPAQHLTIKLVPMDKDSGDRRNGVFARKSIPKRTQFGPLEGQFVTEAPPNVSLDFWTTFNGTEGYLDISEEGFSNWMRFVRPAEDSTQMNCIVIEEEAFIYFLTTTTIATKTELRVGYSKQYAAKYGLPLLTPTEEKEGGLHKASTCTESIPALALPPDIKEQDTSYFKGEPSECRPRRKTRLRSLGSKQGSSPLPHSSRIIKRVKQVSSCSQVSPPTDDPVDHEESPHPTKLGRNGLECSVCDLCFPESQLLQIHCLGHHNEKTRPLEDTPHFSDPELPPTSTRTCPACRKSFETTEELIEHTKEHSVPTRLGEDLRESFKCKLCYKSFSSKDRLVGHSELHKNDSEKPYLCFHCLRKFCNKSALSSHVKLHSEKDGSGTKVYDCPICQGKFYTVSSLKVHLPTHCVNGEYTCPTCSKKFPSYHKIRRHIRSYHSAVHPCHECGKLLPSMEKLKVHLVSHSDRRDFACPVCQKCFKRKDKMKEHLKRIHTLKREPNNNNNFTKKKNNPKFVPKVDPSDYKQFMYKCDLCLVGFKRRGMLVNHLSKRHPNIPLSSIPELNQPILRTSHSYFCQYCEKAYVSTTKRKLHILKNHPGAELPPTRAPMGSGGEGSSSSRTTRTYAASCLLCPRQYSTNAKLLQHQRRHHHGTVGIKEGPTGAPEDAKMTSEEDIVSQALGRAASSPGEGAKAQSHVVRVEPQGATAQTLVELRVQQPTECGRERGPLAKGEAVLVSPSLLLPQDGGAAYALLTPDGGGDTFTFTSLRPGQILPPSMAAFSVLSASEGSPVSGPQQEGVEVGGLSAPSASTSASSSRLLPLEAAVSHSQLALEVSGSKGDPCMVAQVAGSDASSPVLLWQPSLSFAPSS